MFRKTLSEGFCWNFAASMGIVIIWKPYLGYFEKFNILICLPLQILFSSKEWWNVLKCCSDSLQGVLFRTKINIRESLIITATSGKIWIMIWIFFFANKFLAEPIIMQVLSTSVDFRCLFQFFQKNKICCTNQLSILTGQFSQQWR